MAGGRIALQGYCSEVCHIAFIGERIKLLQVIVDVVPALCLSLWAFLALAHISPIITRFAITKPSSNFPI
jgi:hypothetical protein